MSIFDIVLLTFIAGFGLLGLWKGFVWRLVSLVGSILAIYLATRYYAPVAQWVIDITGWSANFVRILVFIAAFVVVNRLVVFVVWLLNKALSIITNLPFVRLVDRIIGLGFGLTEGVLIVGVIFYFIVRFPIGEIFMSWINASQVLPYTSRLVAFFLPLVPEGLRALKSTIEGLL